MEGTDFHQQKMLSEQSPKLNPNFTRTKSRPNGASSLEMTFVLVGVLSDSTIVMLC